jgi:hypothetical protein
MRIYQNIMIYDYVEKVILSEGFIDRAKSALISFWMTKWEGEKSQNASLFAMRSFILNKYVYI